MKMAKERGKRIYRKATDEEREASREEYENR